MPLASRADRLSMVERHDSTNQPTDQVTLAEGAEQEAYFRVSTFRPVETPPVLEISGELNTDRTLKWLDHVVDTLARHAEGWRAFTVKLQAINTLDRPNAKHLARLLTEYVDYWGNTVVWIPVTPVGELLKQELASARHPAKLDELRVDDAWMVALMNRGAQ